MTAGRNARDVLRTAFERLPEGVRQNASDKRLALRQLRGLGQIKANQALLAKKVADLDRQLNARSAPAEVADPNFPDGVRSRLCTAAQLDEPWFRQWCEDLCEPPLAHRKNWEFGYIAEVLARTGRLEPGRRGLGFGVGREPLVAGFAARGAQIVATDIGSDMQEALGWVHSDQHAMGIEGMLRPDVCDEARFRELVTWRPVDMRAVPDDLRGFDFCWSACALEHLGTLEEGWRFIEHSVATLAPGGIAVHTTEYNLGSDDETIEAGPTVIYRERDLMELRDRLEAAGHQVAAFDLSQGDRLLDKYVDVPPYADEPVLRFLVGTYTLTSVAIVVRAGSS